LNLIDGEYVYKEDSYADEMYFLLKGRVNYVVTLHAIVFKSYIKGSYFGEVEIISNINKHLVRCTLFSEEEEILAFGESFLEKPGGKIYLTLRTRTRIHGLTLIAGAKCSSDPY